MKFRTEYRQELWQFQLSAQRPLLLMGSCFTDNIGERMRRSDWDVCVNPCGTLFNPLSIAATIEKAVRDDVRFADGFSWDFPTTFVSEEQCREAYAKVREALERSQALVVTFGTAVAYFRDGEVVANCHKHPSCEFDRKMLSVEQMFEAWKSLIENVLPPELKLIFTISPVRHVRDGFVTNSMSKASLRMLCERLRGAFVERVAYFPSYEIMMDDLRDYRFYAEDMVHPSPVAVEYIWERFQEEFLSSEDRKWLAEGYALTLREEHRPLRPDSSEAAAFRAETARLRALRHPRSAK